MNLFIDTNILLSFLHYTSEDLEELKKLIVLLEQGKVTLFMPEQVHEEFLRNRDGKLADALKRLKELKPKPAYPQFCKDYAEYQALSEMQKQYDEHFNALLKKLDADIQTENLKADAITTQLFKRSKKIKTDDLINIAAARRRRGNPPGKDKETYGDGINWEALLKDGPVSAPLYFISDDRDWASPLNEATFNAFLRDEWNRKKTGELVFYRRLSEFFKEHFPDIKFAVQLEIDQLVEGLATSSNFANTHLLIGRLASYSDFEPAQVNAMVSSALENSQVNWILSDNDVHAFYDGLMKKYHMKMDPNLREKLAGQLEPPPPLDVNGDDIPF